MLLNRFWNDRKAGVAPMLALASIPLFGFVGAAVDYSRANAARTSMQAALDATALMLSKDAKTSTVPQLQEKANAYFHALFLHPEVTNVQVTHELSSPQQGSFSLKVTSSGTIATVFARILGHDTIDISASGEVVWGMKRLNLALALDNTLSMASSGKMEALKEAAHNLLNTLKKAEKDPGDILVSIVPFAVGVNVRTGNVGADWIDWTEWEAAVTPAPGSKIGPGSSCPWSTASNGFRCQVNPTNGSSTTNNVPSNGTYSGYVCPTARQSSNGQNLYYHNGCYNSVLSGSSYQHTWIANARGTWNGCVTDRDQNYDVNATATGGAANYRARQYVACPAAMMPLSSNWDDLHAKIDTMTPTGYTNVTIGMQMAWQTLAPVAPFSAPSPAPDLDKVIILLTDGQNTQNRWTTSTSSIDARTEAACAAAKADNIQIYTVRVIDGNATLLRNCATKPDMYFNVQKASDLNSVFSAIAQKLANLRIAK